jgi:hypothetical protein
VLKSALISILFLPGLTALAMAQANVHVDASMPSSPRCAAERTTDCVQTERAVVRDYLESWKTMGLAFEQNRADLLNADFVGEAMNKLAGTIEEQSTIGMRTQYQDISHDIQFLFYSPEGLSIEFIDVVTLDLQIFDHGRLLATRHETARYLVMMSPSEVRWRVRIFQALQS